MTITASTFPQVKLTNDKVELSKKIIVILTEGSNLGEVITGKCDELNHKGYLSMTMDDSSQVGTLYTTRGDSGEVGLTLVNICEYYVLKGYFTRCL
jgi:hypothetical protein